MAAASRENRKLKSVKYQYSERRARPVKSKYCLRAFRYQCMGGVRFFVKVGGNYKVVL